MGRLKKVLVGTGVSVAALAVIGAASPQPAAKPKAQSVVLSAETNETPAPTIKSTPTATPMPSTTPTPVPTPTATPKRVAVTTPTPVVHTPTPQSNCDPNYSGCVPIASDVDCAGGGGNGPAYVQGPVKVIGTDIYHLDADHDGIGCE